MPSADDEKEESLYFMDEKNSGEELIIVEEPGNIPIALRQQQSDSVKPPSSHVHEDADGDEDEDADEASDKGEEYAEWDGYEQEV